MVTRSGVTNNRDESRDRQRNFMAGSGLHGVFQALRMAFQTVGGILNGGA